MMPSNPFESPSVAAKSADVASKRVSVDRFVINPATFACQSFTPDSLALALQEELANRCRQLGLTPNDAEEPAIRITGTVKKVDEGSQTLRYLVPFLAGAASVDVEGVIHVRGKESRPFARTATLRVGGFGGRNRKMIELAIQRIAISVASEAAGHANPTAEKDSRVAAGYIAIVGAISAILAVSCAMLAYQWALALPRRSNTIKPDEAPTWAIVLAVMIFATIGLLGTALAPTRVLKSRALTWLVAISGMKSITGLRVILIVLSAIAGAVSFGWFSVADGL